MSEADQYPRPVVVTGAAGFIGGCALRTLRAQGHCVVGVDLPGEGFLDHEALLDQLASGELRARAVVHQGAVSDTLASDEERLWSLNYEYSRRLFELCAARDIHLVYASSAAVYGRRGYFVEEECAEEPLNAYARSKLEFDRFVRRARWRGAVGLRYFNVYGPGESHKGRMASLAFQSLESIRRDGVVRLFGSSHGCAPGEHRRDFVHVDDVLAAITWCLRQRASGLFNVGTGRSMSFREIAAMATELSGRGSIAYIDMPERVRAAYQPFTLAALGRLRSAGYLRPFIDPGRGVREYMRSLAARSA